jgi:hypothetical protein
MLFWVICLIAALALVATAAHRAEVARRKRLRLLELCRL